MNPKKSISFYLYLLAVLMEKKEKDRVIRIKPLYHNGTSLAGIYFEYDKELTDIVRRIEGCRWTGIHMCWYVSYTKYNLERVEEILIKKARVHNFFKPEISFAPEKSTKSPRKKHSLPQFINDVPEIKNRKYLEQFSSWMMSRAYSKATVKTYSETLRVFFEFLGSFPAEEISTEDIFRFNKEVIIARNLSAGFQRQTLYVLALFFRSILGKEPDPVVLEKQKKQQKAPGILERGQVAQLLKNTENIKHRALIAMVYSSGLKVGEVLEVMLNDIDSSQMTIRLKKRKNISSRVVPLSSKMLEILRDYYWKFKPKEFLFEGKFGGKYTERSAQLMLKDTVKRSGIKKKVSYQMLRHSYAIHMLESGAELSYLRKLLGQVSKEGIEIYRKISPVKSQKNPSPLDELGL